MKRNKTQSVSWALLLAISIAMLPPCLLSLRQIDGSAHTVEMLADKIAMDTAVGFAVAYGILDRQVLAELNNVREELLATSRDIEAWSETFSRRVGEEYLYHDILLVERDGLILASGRLDSPLSVGDLLESVRATSGDIVRTEAYGERPYEDYVLPYVARMTPDFANRQEVALVFLVRAGLFANSANLPDDIDICLTDRTGRIVFRHPPDGGRGKGSRVPLDIWTIVNSGPRRGSLPTKRESDGLSYSGYSKLVGERGDTYGAVLITMREQALLADVAQGTARRNRILLLVTTLAAMVAAFCAGRALLSRVEAHDIPQDAIMPPLSPNRVETLDEETGTNMTEFITEKIQSKMERQQQSPDSRDFLTGAMTRRTGLSLLEGIRAVSLHEQAPFSLLFTDIDNFRQINETYGSSQGDAILKKAAEIVSSLLRENDVMCRYGGDEFLVILPGGTNETAERLAAEIEDRICNAAGWKSSGVQLLISCGTTTFDPAFPASEEELLTRVKEDMIRRRKSAKGF